MRNSLVEAEAMNKRAEAGFTGACGPEHSYTLLARRISGTLYLRKGRHEEAAKTWEQALEAYDKKLEPDLPNMFRIMAELGTMYVDRNDSRAEAILQRALTGLERMSPPILHYLHPVLFNLTVMYRKAGRFDEAFAMGHRALAVLDANPHFEPEVTLQWVLNLGMTYYTVGRFDEGRMMWIGLGNELIEWFMACCKTIHWTPEEAAMSHWTLKAEEGRLDYLKHYILAIIQILDDWYEDLFLSAASFRHLGRVLVWINDDFNAKLTLQQSVTQEKGVWTHNALCGICDSDLGGASNCYVCKLCKDVDLCQDCYIYTRNSRKACLTVSTTLFSKFQE